MIDQELALDLAKKLAVEVCAGGNGIARGNYDERTFLSIVHDFERLDKAIQEKNIEYILNASLDRNKYWGEYFTDVTGHATKPESVIDWLGRADVEKWIEAYNAKRAAEKAQRQKKEIEYNAHSVFVTYKGKKITQKSWVDLMFSDGWKLEKVNGRFCFVKDGYIQKFAKNMQFGITYARMVQGV